MSKNEPFAPWQCPLCGEKLTGDSTLKCTKGHCFDRAKEGYWHLLPVQSMRTKAPGDSKEMVAGRSGTLEAWGKGTDDYPRRHIRSHVTLDDINEAILYNPRNCYQNYNAATNSSERMLHTYMGTLLPKLRNVSYSTAGELSPLLNDPTCRTIGMGTRIFLCGARGYVSWQGTQFNTSKPVNEHGIPIGGARTGDSGRGGIF